MLADRLGGLFSIIFGGIAVAEAIRLYPMRMADFAGDHTLPGFVGVVLIVLGIILLFKGQAFQVVFPNRNIVFRMVVAIVLLFLYWFLLPYLGYLISTFLISMGLFKVIGGYRILKAAIYSLVATVVLYVIFIWWLNMPFPTGIFDL